MVERINYKNLPTIVGPYVHATKHANTLYVSGLTAMGSDAQKEGVCLQTEEILSQIDRILIAEELTKNNIIKLTIYLADISSLSKIREALFAFYEGALPACSLVEVSALISKELHVEIEAIIALNSSE